MEIQADTMDEQLLYVKFSNAMVLQSIDLPSHTKSVYLSATGNGFALFQLSYRYNVNESNINAFVLTPKVLETTAGHLNVEVCSKLVEKIPKHDRKQT